MCALFRMCVVPLDFLSQAIRYVPCVCVCLSLFENIFSMRENDKKLCECVANSVCPTQNNHKKIKHTPGFSYPEASRTSKKTLSLCRF